MIAPLAQNLPRRYPGLRPFDRTQSALFNGRSTDVQRLANLILRERLVVLFSKSGIGKTSLLQAGVAPELEKQGFAPILMRLNEPEKPIMDAVGSVLKSHTLTGGMDNSNSISDAPETLWELTKRLQFDLDGLPATPVLVFDQFEELFTLNHTEENRTRFLAELANLANESMPEGVRAMLLARLQNTNSPSNAGFMQWWESQPQLRVVLSIRSDFLHLLDEISPLIPGILHNRFQLKPLDRTQASEAIVNPANAEGPYASKPFAYSEEALNEMLDFLSGKLDATEKAEQRKEQQDLDLLAIKRFDEIESFNLQIICQRIEEEVIRRKEPENFTVPPDYYGGKHGLRRELQNFYHNQLESIPAILARRTGKNVDDPQSAVMTARRLIEDSLVTPAGRRCSMVDDILTTNYLVDSDFLDTLVESRLLRKEMRLDDFYFEISHDTLLPAIVESRDERRKAERADLERRTLEQRLAEEEKRREAVEKQLEETRVRRKLAHRVSFFALTTLVFSLALGVYFVYNFRASKREFAHSVEQELAQIERNVRLEIFEAAMPAYDSLLANPVKLAILARKAFKDVAFEKADALRFDSLNKAILHDQATGDSLFFLEDYAGALFAYRQATELLALYSSINYRMSNNLWRIDPLKIADKEKTLDLRIQNSLSTLISQFKIRQTEYETFSQANAWGQAQMRAKAMQKLLPAYPEDLDMLQEALSLEGQSPVDYVNVLMGQTKKALRY